MENKHEENEFSTLIDELLEEDDKFLEESQETKKKTKQVTFETQENFNIKPMDEIHKYYKSEWFLSRELVSNISILALLFILFTNSYSISLLNNYLPICFHSNELSYNFLGSLIFGCILSILYAFLVLK